jgi:hypothetical protein
MQVTKRTLVAVDPGVQGSDERLLSLEVLRVASPMLARTETELHLADAGSLYAEDLITSRYGAKGTQRRTWTYSYSIRRTTSSAYAYAGGREIFHALHQPKGSPATLAPLSRRKSGLTCSWSAAQHGGDSKNSSSAASPRPFLAACAVLPGLEAGLASCRRCAPQVGATTKKESGGRDDDNNEREWRRQQTESHH